MRYGLFLSFKSSVILFLSFMKMFSRINCFSSSINEIRSSHMNPRCKLFTQLISITNPLNPWLEQFQQWAYTILQNRLWVKILQKFYLFVSSEQFEKFHSAVQGTLHDSATHQTHRKILAPFLFSRLQPFCPLFPFSFRLVFLILTVIFGAFLLKQLFYSGSNHTPISYISQTKQKKMKWTFCNAPTSKRRARDPRIVMIDWQLPHFPRATSF